MREAPLSSPVPGSSGTSGSYPPAPHVPSPEPSPSVLAGTRGRLLLFALAVAIVAIVVAATSRDVPRAQGQAERVVMGPAQGEPPVAYEGPDGRVALTGPWTLRSDKADRGTKLGWARGTFTGSEVSVPNSPNAARVTGQAGIVSHEGSIGWYRTTMNVPADGDYALRFESVNHRATVWVDGRQVATHTGEYLPFEAALSLTRGDHTLVVRADWRDPAQMKLDAWHRTWFNFGGINREVTLRPLGPSTLQAPTVTTTLQPGGAAKVDLSVQVTNRTDAARSVPVSGTIGRGDATQPVDFGAVAMPPRSSRVVRASVVVPGAALWSPQAPNLYDVVLQVPGESTFRLRTGLRQITTQGRRLELNGQPLELRGASIHEDFPGVGDAVTGDQMDQLVGELKAIGANATRAQHPLNPALLERLDAAGIMIWQGIGPVDAPGAWTSKTPRLRKQSTDRVVTTLEQAQTHPSIIVWNLANEIAGNGHPGGQAAWVTATAKLLKARDPGRLVGLDIWGPHPPVKAGPMYDDIDAIGDTNYIGWYEDLNLPRSQVAAAIRAHVRGIQRVFPNKVVAVTEFGAEANGANPTRSPGGYDYQRDLLKLHIDVYRKLPGLTGMLVWNLRDFAVAPTFAGGSIRSQAPNIRLVRGLNQKGLFDYAGKGKPSVATVRSLFAPATAATG